MRNDALKNLQVRIPSSTWFHRVSHGFTGFHMVSQGFTWFRRVSHGFTGFRVISQGVTGSVRECPTTRYTQTVIIQTPKSRVLRSTGHPLAQFQSKILLLCVTFCGNSDVTSQAIFMVFPRQHVCDSELRTFQSHGQCPVLDCPDKRGMSVIVDITSTTTLYSQPTRPSCTQPSPLRGHFR